MKLISCLIFIQLVFNLSSQTNFKLSNPACLEILKGNYPQDSFLPNRVLGVDQSFQQLFQNVSADSLYDHLKNIVSFKNRNLISDNPLSKNFGIGACRNWIESRMRGWSFPPSFRLIPCLLEFDQLACNVLTHRELFAILPGIGPRRNELVIVEAHLDSRCEILCDTTCLAEGADDNGSGSALVAELSRVMNPLSFDRTIVFFFTTGEEQGLIGARAFAKLCKANGILIKAVFNNDIVGGVECGNTSSPPSCPGPGMVDSLRLRIFSAGSTNSMAKGLARLSRIVSQRWLVPNIDLVPTLDLMTGEDRVGRGGDHIPFREESYTAIRFTSSFEHGDGNPTQPNYHDRQHSTRDIIGKDIDQDGILDSFYVNFNYLAKNTLINGANIINAASGPDLQHSVKFEVENGEVKWEITGPANYHNFLIGVRLLTNTNFDTLIDTDQLKGSFRMPRLGIFYGSLAASDTNNLISMFSPEVQFRITSANDNPIKEKVELLQNYPNPFDEATVIPIYVHELFGHGANWIEIHSADGHLIKKITLDLQLGLNEIQYEYAWHNYLPGNYYYSLWLKGKKISTRVMTFTN
ncbi:MAG: M28 family peptidase [Bacteroidota bacterium]|nr:M28 family peptidase [Bacteroidota bacterium]